VQRRQEPEREELVRRRGTLAPLPVLATPEHSVLALQRSAGNAAVAQLLQREGDAATFSPVRPGSPLSMRPPAATDPLGALTAGVNDDYAAAMDAVFPWFDRLADDVRKGGSFIQSVAELVDMAGSLVFKGRGGKEAKVRDVVKPNELELGLRERAKTLGVRLLEHRETSDREGVKSEAMAILHNLGRVPTSVEFGGDDAKIEVSIFGKVSGEAKVGKAKLEGEASPGGAEASVTVSAGKGKLEAHASTEEGAGASMSFPGGKVGFDITGKGIKAEVKAGDFVTVKGSVGEEKDGSVAWKAEITIGTLGKVVTAEDVAKVMKGAEETFSKTPASWFEVSTTPTRSRSTAARSSRLSARWSRRPRRAPRRASPAGRSVSRRRAPTRAASAGASPSPGCSDPA